MNGRDETAGFHGGATSDERAGRAGPAGEGGGERPRGKQGLARLLRAYGRVTSILLGIGLLVAGGTCQSYRWFTTPRASTDRVMVRMSLRAIGQSFGVYRAEHGNWPTLGDLVRRGELYAEPARQFALVRYTSEAKADERRVLVAQRAPCRAVRRGEPWGGPGETTDRDMPAARYVLYDDLRVDAMTEDEFQKQYGSRIELLDPDH
ncbi:MAG: hypothetical protein CHACPFDD_01628 [Phycisphaerae bacterium]|nr:hypothetical protein [Phycisphaerae bacterium]